MPAAFSNNPICAGLQITALRIERDDSKPQDPKPYGGSYLGFYAESFLKNIPDGRLSKRTLP